MGASATQGTGWTVDSLVLRGTSARAETAASTTLFKTPSGASLNVSLPLTHVQ